MPMNAVEPTFGRTPPMGARIAASTPRIFFWALTLIWVTTTSITGTSAPDGCMDWAARSIASTDAAIGTAITLPFAASIRDRAL